MVGMLAARVQVALATEPRAGLLASESASKWQHLLSSSMYMSSKGVCVHAYIVCRDCKSC
jgi:hypothetical protein